MDVGRGRKNWMHCCIVPLDVLDYTYCTHGGNWHGGFAQKLPRLNRLHVDLEDMGCLLAVNLVVSVVCPAGIDWWMGHRELNA